MHGLFCCPKVSENSTSAQPPDSSWCHPEPKISPSCSTSQKCFSSTSPVAGFKSSWFTQTLPTRIHKIKDTHIQVAVGTVVMPSPDFPSRSCLPSSMCGPSRLGDSPLFYRWSSAPEPDVAPRTLAQS